MSAGILTPLLFRIKKQPRKAHVCVVLVDVSVGVFLFDKRCERGMICSWFEGVLMAVSVLLVEYLIVAVLFLFFLFVWHATRVSISHLVRFPVLVLLDYVIVFLIGLYLILQIKYNTITWKTKNRIILNMHVLRVESSHEIINNRMKW